MHPADIWLRLTRTAGLLTIAALAAESIASFLGYLPDLGHAAQFTVIVGALCGGGAYVMHRLLGIWSR